MTLCGKVSPPYSSPSILLKQSLWKIQVSECEMVWLKLLPVGVGAVADVAPRDAAGSLVAEDELGALK